MGPLDEISSGAAFDQFGKPSGVRQSSATLSPTECGGGGGCGCLPPPLPHPSAAELQSEKSEGGFDAVLFGGRVLWEVTGYQKTITRPAAAASRCSQHRLLHRDLKRGGVCGCGGGDGDQRHPVAHRGLDLVVRAELVRQPEPGGCPSRCPPSSPGASSPRVPSSSRRGSRRRSSWRKRHPPRGLQLPHAPGGAASPGGYRTPLDRGGHQTPSSTGTVALTATVTR